MFKLPIEYRKSYPTQGAMIQDLELCAAEEGPSMLECVFEPKTTLASKMLPKWAAQYTDDVEFLKDSVKVCKRLEVESHDPSPFLAWWEELHSTAEFNAVYQYVDYSKLDFLNKNSMFLLLMTFYSLASPVLFILSPLLIVLLPFAILKVKNIPVQWDQYFLILKDVLRKHAIGGLLLGFGQADMQQRAYLIGTVALFGVQLYANVYACYTFYKSLKKTYAMLDSAKDYVGHVLGAMKAIAAAADGVPTYADFLLEQTMVGVVLTGYHDMLCQPYKTVGQVGRVRKMLYQLKTDRALKEAIEYSFGVHGYAENLATLRAKLAAKEVTACKFSKRTSFKGARYPVSAQYRANSYSLKNYLITGPNASGKTTFIKTTMLNVLFSQQFGAGFYTKASVHPFQNLCCYINIPDTSGRDSLFQAEARRCKEILDIVQKGRSFCIFDELFSGTNPLEATASAYAFLQHLVKNEGCTFLLTTHFIELCERSTNIMSYHMATLPPHNYTYGFTKGISYVRGGVQVLSQLGFPPSIIECAKKYR